MITEIFVKLLDNVLYRYHLYKDDIDEFLIFDIPACFSKRFESVPCIYVCDQDSKHSALASYELDKLIIHYQVDNQVIEKIFKLSFKYDSLYSPITIKAQDDIIVKNIINSLRKSYE